MKELRIVDDKKMAVCTLCNVYLENNSYLELVSEELKRLLPFPYLVQPA